MNIPIKVRNKAYTISGDISQYILTPHTKKGLGKSWYYKDLDTMLEDIHTMGLRTAEDVTSFRGLREESELLRGEIKKALAPLCIEITITGKKPKK